MARTGRKFGWHSGTLTAKKIECLGDIEVQDDIVFTDVSAGVLGVDGGIKTDAAFTGKFIETGTYSSSASNGMTLSSTYNRPVSFLSDDAGAAMTGDIRAVLSRVMLTVDQATPTVNAMRAQLKMADLVDITGANAVISPFTAYLELAGTGARTLTGHVAAMRVAIEEGASGTTTIAASSYYAGLELTLNSTRTYTETGDFGAIVININTGTSVWNNGIFIVSGSCTTGIDIGTCTTGIDIGTCTGGLVFTGTTNYIMDFDNVTTGAATITSGAASTIKAQMLVKTPAGDTGYINIYGTTGT